MTSSHAYGDALAAELPHLTGRAGNVAPNRVQNGSQRDGDTGGGSHRRQLAIEATRKLAALWSAGRKRVALVWYVYFVLAGPDERSRWECGKPGAYARRVHLLTLDREERIKMLSESSGPEATASRVSGIGLISGAEEEFSEAEPIDSSGSWFDQLRTSANDAVKLLGRDEAAANAVRAARKAERKSKREVK